MTEGFASDGTSGVCPHGSPVASLVLRAWVEPGGAPQLRTRVVEVAPGRPDRPMVVTTSVDEACLVVRTWLARQQQRASSGDDAVTPRE
jgi:hypothetical protein